MKRHSEEEYSERPKKKQKKDDYLQFYNFLSVNPLLDEDSSDLIYSQTNLNNEEPSCSNFRIIPGYSDKIDLYPIASNNSRTIPRVLQLVDPINGEDSKLMKIDFGLHSQPTGQGGFSSVYKGEIISPDETDPLVISGQKDFAFKIVRSDLSDYWLNEVNIYKLLMRAGDYSQHLVPFIGYAEDTIVMNLMQSNLSTYLQTTQISQEEKVQILLKLLASVSWVHNQNVLHRDLTPDNVFVQEGKILLGDFGISLTENQEVSDYFAHGKLEYRAPEGSITKKSDVFSFGCIIYEIFTGRTAFSNRRVTALDDSVILSELDYLKSFTRVELVNIVRKCWRKQEDRADLNEIKKDLESLIIVN